MNFTELLKYAVEVEGEELSTWKYFDDQRIRNEMFSILVSVYDMTSYDINNSLIRGFQERIINESGKYEKVKSEIDNNVATTSLVKEFAALTRNRGDAELSEQILDILPNLPEKKPLNKQVVKKNLDGLTKTFMSTIKESYVEKIKNELIVDHKYTIDELNSYSNFKILSLYNSYKDKDNKIKKIKTKYTTNV